MMCSLCEKPATESHDFTGCKHNSVELGVEPLCFNCLCAFIEGASRGDLAVFSWDEGYDQF